MFSDLATVIFFFSAVINLAASRDSLFGMMNTFVSYFKEIKILDLFKRENPITK